MNASLPSDRRSVPRPLHRPGLLEFAAEPGRQSAALLERRHHEPPYAEPAIGEYSECGGKQHTVQWLSKGRPAAVGRRSAKQSLIEQPPEPSVRRFAAI